MSDYLPAETSYVVFADLHVRVENHSEAEIHSDITDLFGAMIRSEPVGTETLRLALYRHHHKILLIDPTAAACEFDTVGEATNAFFHRIIQALMRAKPKLLWLHAGAAARDGRALLFLGPSRSGKSTLVTELTRTGWHYLSDEVAPIDPHARTVMPFPLTPLVRKPGRAAVEQSRFGELKKDVFALDSVVIADKAVTIGAFILPSYRTDAKAQITLCSPATAVIEMLNNSLNLKPYTKDQVGQFCELIAQTPCYRLIYADVTDAIALLQAPSLSSEYI